MRAVVHLRQLRGGQLRIPLRRRQALMTEQFLDSAQIRAFFQQMRAERVAQCVRMHIRREAAQNRDALDNAANAAGRQPCLSTRIAAGLAQAAQLQVDEQRGRRSSLPVARRSQARRGGYARMPFAAASPNGT